MSYEERINQLKDEFSKNSHKLRMADVEGSHTDTCTKCTVKPIVKEHMCEGCYKEHNEWLRNQARGIRIGDYLSKNHKFSKEELEKAIDDEQWITLYESGAK